MASFQKTLEIALQKRGIKRDKDVDELYLSQRNLLNCEDLKRFKYMKKLWINGNKLRHANFLSCNFHLSELYLHDNHLSDISGCLRHLTCLVVLTLHNNQLTHLEKTLKELDKMKSLSVLNLFNNPAAQEPGYRTFTIHMCPSLTLLDRSEVTRNEQEKASQMYSQDKTLAKSRVAFGRKSEGPPTSHSAFTRRTTSVKQDPTEATNQVNGNLKVNTNENPEEAVNIRFLKKSLTMYSIFDWSKVPRLEARRQTDSQFSLPRILTFVYR
ncbi:leucine-rich repeat-containing protein 72 [Biomphalaria glabrata]|nr:leucine-rich repeat-containing protein 72-like [Biomphalaria glabrata]